MTFGRVQKLTSYLHPQIARIQGIGKQVDLSPTEVTAFHETGVPDLRDLKCHDLPSLHGDVLCKGLLLFKHLTTVEFVHCVSIVE